MLIVVVIKELCYIETNAYNLLSVFVTCVAAQSTDACVSITPPTGPSSLWFKRLPLKQSVSSSRSGFCRTWFMS